MKPRTLSLLAGALSGLAIATLAGVGVIAVVCAVGVASFTYVAAVVIGRVIDKKPV